MTDTAFVQKFLRAYERKRQQDSDPEAASKRRRQRCSTLATRQTSGQPGSSAFPKTVARVTADLACLLGLFEPSLLHAVVASYLEKNADDVQAAVLDCDFVRGLVQEQQRAVLGIAGEHYAQVSLSLE